MTEAYINIKNVLEQGLAAMSQPVQTEQITRLLRYIDLLAAWNRVYSITAIKKQALMVPYHLLDSIATQPVLEGILAKTPIDTHHHLIDIGSGGGQPGIPLAIMNPNLPVTLLDANHKKTAFLRQAVIELELNNVHVVCQRVEDFKPLTPFTMITSRAFADLSLFISSTRHLCHRHGTWLALKGPHVDQELIQLPPDIMLDQHHTTTIPGISGIRHLLTLHIASEHTL